MSCVSCETPWKPATIAIAPSSRAVADAPGGHVDDARLAVRGVGDDARLAASERARLVAHARDRHREQRHRDALPGGQQHVELAHRRQRAHLAGEVDQLVGRVAHRRDDHDDVVAGLLGLDDAAGDPLDRFGVGDGRATVLLHEQAHSGLLNRRSDAGWHEGVPGENSNFPASGTPQMLSDGRNRRSPPAPRPLGRRISARRPALQRDVQPRAPLPPDEDHRGVGDISPDSGSRCVPWSRPLRRMTRGRTGTEPGGAGLTKSRQASPGRRARRPGLRRGRGARHRRRGLGRRHRPRGRAASRLGAAGPRATSSPAGSCRSPTGTPTTTTARASARRRARARVHQRRGRRLPGRRPNCSSGTTCSTPSCATRRSTDLYLGPLKALDDRERRQGLRRPEDRLHPRRRREVRAGLHVRGARPGPVEVPVDADPLLRELRSTTGR